MVQHPLSKREVTGSNPIGGFACLCRPIQCVCTSLGPTKPGRDDLDSIFQERRRKITLVGKLSKSSRRCFGNVPALAPANFSLPTAHTGSKLGLSGVSACALPSFQQPCLQGKGGVLHTGYLELEHSSGWLVEHPPSKREVMGSIP